MYSSPFRWPTPKRLWRRTFGDGFRGKVRLALVVLVAAAIIGLVVAGCSAKFCDYDSCDYYCVGWGC